MKPGRVLARAAAVAAFVLAAAGMLGGCASLQAAAVASAMDRMMPGQPVVNAYSFHRTPWGPWAAVSVWRVGGRQRSAALEPIDSWPVDGLGIVEVVAPAPEADRVRALLESEAAGCGSPRTLVLTAAARVTETMKFLRQAPRRVPRVRWLVIPPGQGHAGLDLSFGGAFSDVVMTISTQLPESHTCLWLRYWAAQALDTLYHELFHGWRFAQVGPSSDLLREEFVAYAIGDCVARLSDPDQRPRVRTFPGLDHLPVQTIVDAGRTGRIPPTIAGRYVAHLQGPAQDKTPGDGWREACASLADDYPNFIEP